MTKGILAYPARIKDDGETRLVTFRDLPEAITYADHDENLFEEAMDCLGTALTGLLEEGADWPKASKAQRGEVMIPVPALVAVKFLLRDAVAKSNQTQTAIARDVEIDERAIRRMLDPTSSTKIGTMQDILAHLGRGFAIVEVNPPARALTA